PAHLAGGNRHGAAGGSCPCLRAHLPMPSPRDTAAALFVVVAVATPVRAAPDPAAPGAAAQLAARGPAPPAPRPPAGALRRPPGPPGARPPARPGAAPRRPRPSAGAEPAGGCLLTGDEPAAATAVIGFLDDVRTRAGASGRLSRCARRALLAACTRARALLD